MKLILLVFGILAATNQEVRAAELIGRVTDTDTGAPLQGVNLQIQGLPVADQTTASALRHLPRYGRVQSSSPPWISLGL